MLIIFCLAQMFLKEPPLLPHGHICLKDQLYDAFVLCLLMSNHLIPIVAIIRLFIFRIESSLTCSFQALPFFPLSKNCFGIINATKGYMQQTILDFDKEAIFLFGAFIMPFFLQDLIYWRNLVLVCFKEIVLCPFSFSTLWMFEGSLIKITLDALSFNLSKFAYRLKRGILVNIVQIVHHLRAKTWSKMNQH